MALKCILLHSLKDTSLTRSLACPSGRARVILSVIGTQLVHPPGQASGACLFLAGLPR